MPRTESTIRLIHRLPQDTIKSTKTLAFSLSQRVELCILATVLSVSLVLPAVTELELSLFSSSLVFSLLLVLLAVDNALVVVVVVLVSFVFTFLHHNQQKL